jgi:hypothetical protein
MSRLGVVTSDESWLDQIDQAQVDNAQPAFGDNIPQDIGNAATSAVDSISTGISDIASAAADTAVSGIETIALWGLGAFFAYKLFEHVMDDKS